MVDLSIIPVDRTDNNFWPVASLSLCSHHGNLRFGLGAAHVMIDYQSICSVS